MQGLMMNNKKDRDIPFEQGIQFFLALRRLGKRVWMLQYDGEDHIVFDKAAELVMIYTDPRHDYTDFVLEELGLGDPNDKIK